MPERCPWPGEDQQMLVYHDTEWGVPLHDDRGLFEYLVLDAAQAGLSWRAVLHKREGYRRAFRDYDLNAVAGFGVSEVERLMQDASIIRNRRKIEGVIKGAQVALGLQHEFGSLDAYFWRFTGGKTVLNHWAVVEQVPATSPQSEAMSADMRKRGFTFCGPTICYAFMQAAGMVNDHLTTCFRHAEVQTAVRS